MRSLAGFVGLEAKLSGADKPVASTYLATAGTLPGFGVQRCLDNGLRTRPALAQTFWSRSKRTKRAMGYVVKGGPVFGTLRQINRQFSSFQASAAAHKPDAA